MALANPAPISFRGREENLEEREERERRRKESPARIFTAEEELADLEAGQRPNRSHSSRSRSNSRKRLRARRDSRSISPAFRQRYRSPSPPRLECFTSHTDLFSTPNSQAKNKGGVEAGVQDRCVLLTPFMREAYITTHPATNLDFTTWLPLLALGAPETWYAFGVAEAPIQMSARQPLLAPQSVSLTPQKEPRPVGLRVPRISAGAALLPPAPSAPVKKDPFDTIPVPIKNEGGTKPPPAGSGSSSSELIYLSIQSTITGVGTHRPDRFSYSSPDRSGLPDVAGSSITGQSIYCVVRAGSREEAAAQAFYAAAGNRWSTLFTCVVLDPSSVGERRLSGRVLVCDEDKYRRVASVEELVAGDAAQKGSRMKVFY
ncbi:hypothetical protein BDV06DRAFT_219409 [Aspergillus oleicola]